MKVSTTAPNSPRHSRRSSVPLSLQKSPVIFWCTCPRGRDRYGCPYLKHSLPIRRQMSATQACPVASPYLIENKGVNQTGFGDFSERGSTQIEEGPKALVDVTQEGIPHLSVRISLGP